MRRLDQRSGQPRDHPITLIVEPNERGHRLYYVRLLIEECYSKGQKAIVLTTKAVVESGQWRVHIGDLGPALAISSLGRFTLRHIADVAARERAEITVLPEADRYLPSLFIRGWTGPGKLNLLVMRSVAQPGSTRPWLRPAKTALKIALILGLRLHGNIEAFVLRSPLVARNGPLRWLPEPVTLASSPEQIGAIRRNLERFGRRYWFGVVGSTTARKNLPLIIRALPHQADTGIVIAGSVAPEVAATVAPLLENFQAHGGAVVRIPGTLTDADFDSVIGAVDCIVAAHSNEGPSAVVLKAAVSGSRLVLAGAKSLRQDAIHLGDQATWSPLEIDALSQALREARESPMLSCPPRFGVERFVRALTS